MNQPSPAPSDVVDALFAAFERNDPDAIAACCEPDASFSKNGAASGPLAGLLPGFATLHERIGHHRYTEVRRAVFDGGFVEEHRVETVLPNGTPYTVVACVVGSFSASGLISELREYVDSGLPPASGAT